ncbi:hypothetical protein [Apibacter sp. HY039]|uniref:hypothetical protein n=1 Tax=Apibacter sp. HY039 TaxID=2501476 RepID=UPI000FEB6915|nr:hypothetical protein [Apibacter sp. HY039]
MKVNIKNKIILTFLVLLISVYSCGVNSNYKSAELYSVLDNIIESSDNSSNDFYIEIKEFKKCHKDVLYGVSIRYMINLINTDNYHTYKYKNKIIIFVSNEKNQMKNFFDTYLIKCNCDLSGFPKEEWSETKGFRYQSIVNTIALLYKDFMFCKNEEIIQNFMDQDCKFD